MTCARWRCCGRAVALGINSWRLRPMAGSEPDWRLDLASLGEWLRCQPRPLAMLCWNDSSGREIVFASHEAGLLVPDEVGVLSHLKAASCF